MMPEGLLQGMKIRVRDLIDTSAARPVADARHGGKRELSSTAAIFLLGRRPVLWHVEDGQIVGKTATG